MATSERDAKLVLRAEDRATKTFEQVGRSINDLTRNLKEQAKAALAGEGSLDDLNNSLKEIQRNADDLEKQRSAIRAFERSGEAAEKAAAAVTRSAAAYDTYKAKLDAAGATTDAQATRLGKLAASVDKTQAALDRQSANVDKARARLTALGLAADDTAGQLDQIQNVFRELTPLYGEATTAVNGFQAAQARAVAEGAKAAAADKQRAAEQVQLEKQRRDAAELSLRLLQQREAEEKRAADATAKAARDAASIDARNAGLAQLSADATAAATNLNRFAQTSEAATFGITRLGDAIRGVVAPAVASVQTLDGALKQVEDSAATAAATQKKRTSEYQDSLNQLTQAQAALVRQADNIDSFNRQTVAVDRLDAELAQAARSVEAFAAELLAADRPVEEVEADLRKASAQLERVGEQAKAARTRFVELGDGLRRAGIDTENLTGEIARLQAGAARSAGVVDNLTKKVGGGAGGRGFLGLKGYELQNLSFQINDIFTSLASGISPTQTLAQQGGQIVQIFPGILSKFLALLPVIAPLAVGFGLLAFNIAKTNKEAAAVKGFDQLFTLAGDSSGVAARQFGQAQVALEKLGLSADQAKTTLRAFNDAGLDRAGLDSFIKTVDAIAKATGEDVPAAAEKYAAALSGGFDQVVALNDVTHTLNETQLQEIERLFDAGQAQEARTRVAEIYRQKADEIANKSKSEWSQATERLEKAFGSLNDSLYLSQGASAIAQRALGEVVGVIDRITGAARDAKAAFDFLVNGSKGFQQGQARLGNRFEEVTPESRSYVKNLRRNVSPVAADTSTDGGRGFLKTQQTQLKNAKLLTSQERLRVAETDAANAAAKAGASNVEIAQAKVNARKIEQAKLDAEAATRSKAQGAAARKSENEAEAAARKAEARQDRINALTKDLENTFDSLASNKAADPFGAIQTKADIAVRNIRAKFAELAKLGVTQVGGRNQQAFEDQVKAASVIETSQARQKQNEEDVNKLLELRKITLADIEDRQRTGDITPKKAIEEASIAVETLNPQIEEASRRAAEFARALRGATPDPKLEAFIARMESVQRESLGRQGFVEAGLSGLKESKGTLDALVAQRDAVVELQNALVKAGFKTAPDAQRAITAAFENSRPAILAAANDVEGIVDALLKIPGLSPTVVASLTSLKAGLTSTRAETKLLDADVVALQNAAVQALSGALGDFITTLGTTIADVIDGTSSLKDALGGIAGAALSFAASFTKAIAQAIIQLVALKIAKAALSATGFGGFHQGGVIGRTGPTFTRKVSPLAFAGAVRYHTGGLVGTRPDEVPAILQKGEEVITANDPRHRDNGGLKGAGGGAPINAKIINLFDAGEAVSQGANTRAGEQAIMNVVMRNKTSLGIPG